MGNRKLAAKVEHLSATRGDGTGFETNSISTAYFNSGNPPSVFTA